MFVALVAGLIFILQTAFTSATVGGYISPTDNKKFISILIKSLQDEREDVSSPYFGAIGLKLLNEPIDQSIAKQTCSHLQKRYRADGSPEQLFQLLSTWSALKCTGKLYDEVTLKSLRLVLESEKSSTTDIRYAAEALKTIGQSVPNPAKTAQLLQTKLKLDDALLSLGQAVHAASLLGNAGKFALDRVEDIVVQLDEVDGKILQWEGGLSTTSHLITGLLALPGAKPFTPTQADKLANYLLTRKTVQTAKGIVALLEAAAALSHSSVSPVSISIIGQSFVTTDKPDLKIRVSDLLGKPVKPTPAPVIALSVTRVADDGVVVSKQPLSPGSDPTEFILALRLEPGQYRVALTAGTHSLNVNVRVLGQVSLQSFEIGLADVDGSSASRLTKIQHPAKLSSVLQADSSHQLIAKFSLSRPIHQTFLRLHSGKKEIIFIAEQDSTKVYKVEVNLLSELSNSGTFDMELILGDPIMSNPVRWSLGKIEVNLGKYEPENKATHGPKPEIRHLFRQAEKRPPQTVSLLFSILTAAPLLLLLGLWLKIGINFSNFSFTSIPFHIGFGSILLLFLCFWLKLDMFQTCAWLIPLGTLTFLSGHKVLSQIARSKKLEKKEKE